MADRKAANRLSAEISRDEKRQRLGVAEFNRQRAEVMRKHRKKQREEAEMAQAQAEGAGGGGAPGSGSGSGSGSKFLGVFAPSGRLWRFFLR